MEYTNILGIRVVCANREDVLARVGQWVAASRQESGLSHTLSYVNAHCLNMASRNREYFQHLRSFDLIYPDGIGAVWAGRWLTGNQLHKMTGADWIFEFCELAQANRWRIYILGGKPGVAETAAQNLRQRFSSLIICGTHTGYFSEAEEPVILSEIAAHAPDVLFVGLGVPLQEAWIFQTKSQLPVKICWAVGALFDYVAGVEPRAPAWMRNYDLEWLWRMLVDPVGKWKRYLLGNPIFMLRVLKQKIGFRG